MTEAERDTDEALLVVWPDPLVDSLCAALLTAVRGEAAVSLNTLKLAVCCISALASQRAMLLAESEQDGER